MSEYQRKQKYDPHQAMTRQQAIASDHETRPVMREYGSLSQQINQVARDVGELEMLLAPVLGPEGVEKGNTKDDAPLETLSPLAESLRSETHNLASISSRLASLRNRLEVKSRHAEQLRGILTTK